MQPAKTVCEVSALAKLNVFLEVRGKRGDGYHELRSVVLPLTLADRLRLRLTPGGGIRARMLLRGVTAPGATPSDENLIVRAARLDLRARSARESALGLRIALDKRIPIGGGLGGGSADAAATLIALEHLLGRHGTTAERLALAATLGSDVPALLQGGAVTMRGRGERLETLLHPGEAPRGFWVVVANPGLHVATAEIYRHCKQLTPPPDYYKNIVRSVRRGDVHAASGALFNGLQPTVFERYPAIERLHAQLIGAGALGAMVCGSGASVFALAETFAHALAIQKQLPETCWSVVSQTLPDGVMVAHGPLEP